MPEPLSDEEIAEGLRVYNPGDPEYRALAELRSLRSPERVGWRPPAGWKLVPVEPTVAMRMPFKSMRGFSFYEKWRALLDATPAPPDTPATGDGR